MTHYARECISCPAGYFGLQKEWTLGITAQAITESAGVTVTQGVGAGLVTGKLKTALQNEWTLARDITR